MAVPTPKVEIGFDIVGANANLLTLDNPTKGQLDNPAYPLGGQIFYDVTSRVKSIATRRGKNRQLDQFDGGLANVVFDNNDRTFDPEYVNSPYYGQIIPKRAIRISSGQERIFTGVIDDWNLNYTPGGDSEASAASSDAFSLFNTQTLPAGTATPQLTGARINAILDLADVDWPTQDRNIEAGQTLLGADVFPEDGNVLEYLRTVGNSEPGNFFIDANGHVAFTDRQATPTSGGVTLADDGTGIPYQGMKVVYGSELLYNEIVIGSDLAGTVVAQDLASIAQYGVLNLTQTGLLMSDPAYVQNLALFYAQKFSTPEYRFESVEVLIDELSPANQTAMLGLEIGDFVTVKFTPNNIAPSIEKIAEIIRIDHDISPENHIMSIGFSTLDYFLLVLDDPEFGKLDAGALAF